MANREIKVLNDLLKGELSARDTYQQAIEKFKGSETEIARQARKLDSIKTDHEKAIRELADCVREHGGTPPDSSGVWGTWAQFVEGSAKMIGHVPALLVLKKGEEIGLAQYEKALSDGELSAGSQDHIRDSLVPRQFAHIQALRVLSDSV